MEVNGRTLISKLDVRGEEGFETTVLHRWTESRHEDGNVVQVPHEIIGGSFYSLKAAVNYAMSWSDPMNPPSVPRVTEVPTADVSDAAVEESHS